MSEKIKLSRIALGMMRLMDWNLSTKKLEKYLHQAIDLQVTTMDHADIYGNYQCEKFFGKVLRHNPALRENLQIISKCGIKLPGNSNSYNIKTYDLDKDYIITQAESSLRNLNTDYLDLFLLHRPSPLQNYEEVSRALEHLIESGKIKYAGVSNYTTGQIQILQSYCTFPLVVNQIECSIARLEPFNQHLHFLQQYDIKPMAWSPLAGGLIFRNEKIRTALLDVAAQHNTNDLDTIAISFLLKHPSKIIPVIGSGKIERLRNAVEAYNINLNQEQWFSIYKAGLGHEIA